MKLNLKAFLAIFVLTLLVAACKAPETSSDNVETPTQPEAPGEDIVQPGTPTDREVLGQDLKQVLMSRLTKYTAEYAITAQESTQNMKMVYDLPRFVTVTQTPQGEVRTIFDNEKYFVCNNMEEGWQCYKMDIENSDSSKIESDVEDGKATVVYTGTCNIAGESGNRYEITSDNSKVSMCYTTDGIMLEMVTSNTEMKALSVARTVDSSLFTPPAAPVDINSLYP
ncbi:MAG: hypothetical protein ABIJ34_09595 [archaeon]